jgi:hypothetical protein
MPENSQASWQDFAPDLCALSAVCIHWASSYTTYSSSSSYHLPLVYDFGCWLHFPLLDRYFGSVSYDEFQLNEVQSDWLESSVTLER